MKKIILFFGIILSVSATQAQNINDAFRYSQTEPLGTARFRALSGAFGAVGGDLSAISSNPASSAVFNNNQVALTLSNYETKENINYFGTKSNQSFNDLDLNQVGGVFVFKNNHQNAGWKKFAVSINYEKQNNFEGNLFFKGTNPSNSIDKYFLAYANGVKLGDLDNLNFDELTFTEQQAYLAYNAFIIDPLSTSPGNTEYLSGVLPGDFKQEYSLATTGYNGKLTFNTSGNFNDILMIGLNLNYHLSDYIKSSRYFESNDNNTTADDYVKRIYFNNDIKTYGSGFSLQAGAILKLGKHLRLGGTLESPTWHSLTDEVTQNITAVNGNNVDELAPHIVDPNTTIIFPSYTVKTPGKITGSAALVFGKQGFISVDYSSKNYKNMRLSPLADYAEDNDKISDLFKRSNELKVGCEFKIEKWSLRGGFRTESSPYKDTKIMGNLKGYSGGLGYNFGGTRLDFAYSTSERDYGYQMFATGLTDRANVSQKNNNITLTLAFEL